jgi:hypothetical protein
MSEADVVRLFAALQSPAWKVAEIVTLMMIVSVV